MYQPNQQINSGQQNQQQNCGEKDGCHGIVLDGKYLPVIFRQQSSTIAKDIVRYVCMREDADPPPNRSCQVMRNLVDDMLKERLDMMKNLVNTLNLNERDQLDLIYNIATQMFDDQMVTWGRIVTLHTFCAYLARYCEEGPFPDSSDDIAKILCDIVVNRLGLWIMANGGWRAFDKQFPTVFMFDTNGAWKAVVLLAVLIGVCIAFATSVRYINS